MKELELTKEYLIDQYINKKLDTNQIANNHNLKRKRVYYLMKKYDIPRRSRGDIGVNDLSEKRFGKLMVIEKDRTKENNTGAIWKCKCDCGNIKSIKGASLSAGYIKSCGCIWKHAKYEDISGIYLNGIKCNARHRKLDCSITPEYIWNIFVHQNKKCALSGVDIFFDKIRKNQTASLDRIDSSKGYVEGNIRWVHKDVNKLKNDWSDDDLLKWVGLIHSHQSSIS